jgi:CheY-like chemotaxis protein
MVSVLVVDDHEAFLSFVEQGLLRHGHTPIIARSGAEALRRLETEPVEIVVTDVMMPGMDGIELLREIRSRRPDLPVIAMTGAGDGLRYPVTTLMHALGARAVLAKPFVTTTLIAAMDACRDGNRS